MGEEEKIFNEGTNEEYVKEQLNKEAELRNTARRFFTTEGKDLYCHLLYDVCGFGRSCLDVENTARMTARCAKQEVGNRLRQLVEEDFNVKEFLRNDEEGEE